MPNRFNITGVFLVCENGPWLSYQDAKMGQVCDPALVAQMQQRVEESGGLPPGVPRSWFSTPEEKAAPGDVHMRNIGEKVVSPWMQVCQSSS